MNHIKTMLCGNLIGIDKLERLKLLQSASLLSEFDISIKESETVLRFLGNFSFKTTQMLREINFKVFRKLLRRSKLKSITIDIDSSVVNVEGHQEGTAKGYNPQKPGNPCYNIQFAICDEIKAYLTRYVRSGDTYMANGAAGRIQEIIAHVKEEGLEVTFRMDSGYFDEDLYEYFFFVTNTERPSEEVVDFYQKRGNCENYIKEAKYNMAVGHLLLKSFWSNEAIFQLMMLAYNLFLLFKIDFLRATEYRQQIKTFRLKYIFLAGKIIRTARRVVMKLSEKYPYREIYGNSLSG